MLASSEPALFARSLRAGLLGDADICVRQGRRVIGAIAAHGDQLALGLFFSDELQLGLRRRLGQEVVDPGFGGDGGGGQCIVAGDHHGADAHAAQFLEALADAALDHVFEMDDSEDAVAIGHGQWRAAALGDAFGDLGQFR